MLDHVLIEVVSTIKDSCEDSMLESADLDEHLLHDVWLGDITYSSSFSLPGESDPPASRVDITLEWSTWSQSNYRTWWIGDVPLEQPEVSIVVAFRLQGELGALDGSDIEKNLGAQTALGSELSFTRTGLRSESFVETPTGKVSHALEVSYEGKLVLTESMLANPIEIRAALAPIGSWLASALVMLSDRRPPSGATA